MKGKIKLDQVILEIFMLLLSLMIVIPLLIMVLGSVKTPAEAVKFSISLPSVWKFDNYIYVIVQGKMLRAFYNSTFIVLVSVPACVILAALGSYIIARRSSKLTNRIINYFMLGMIAPFQVITTYALLKVTGLMGSYLGVILIFTAVNLPWSIFLFTSFIKTVPRQLDEAAILDGCTPTKTFFIVILPLLKPIVATNVIITAMSVWNDFMIPLYFLDSSEKWTLPLSVFNFFGRYFSDWNYVFANLMITSLPITVLYLYSQKYIIAGMTVGAVKG